MVREMRPRERFWSAELPRSLKETQGSNEQVKRRAALRASPGIPP